MFYKTFICFNVSEAKRLCFIFVFCFVFVHECLMMLNGAEDTTFKMFVTQMNSYLFVISISVLMFYKTLRYRLAKASCKLYNAVI